MFPLLIIVRGISFSAPDLHKERPHDADHRDKSHAKFTFVLFFIGANPGSVLYGHPLTSYAERERHGSDDASPGLCIRAFLAQLHRPRTDFFGRHIGRSSGRQGDESQAREP
jgi:hypothetical protein